jgi:hypothetical protein
MDPEFPEIRVLVRTGDTPQRERAAMLRKPPHILVTTPESLYILLTAKRGREMLSTVKTVIVDEIHALTRDKRGSHLAMSLERLEELVRRSEDGGRKSDDEARGLKPTLHAAEAELHATLAAGTGGSRSAALRWPVAPCSDQAALTSDVHSSAPGLPCGPAPATHRLTYFAGGVLGSAGLGSVACS